jgi:RNA polymerase sigma-70 factor (ECF subfamily)
MRWHLHRVAEGNAKSELGELQHREVTGIFQELASGLTARQRVAFLLREVEGLSSQEVASILGCRQSTVRNHLFNARRYLRRELASRFPEYAPGGEDSA